MQITTYFLTSAEVTSTGLSGFVCTLYWDDCSAIKSISSSVKKNLKIGMVTPSTVSKEAKLSYHETWFSLGED